MNCCDFPKLARDRITIRSQTLVTDVYGGQALTWADVGTYWAWLKPVSFSTQSEKFLQDQNQAVVTHKAVIRYNSDFKDIKDFSAYSITFDSRTYGIMSIKNLDKTLKNYGREFQEILMEDNAPELQDS